MIIAWNGLQGSGKTISMTYFAIKNSIENCRTIHTNMTLKGVNYIPVTKQDLLNYTNDESELRNTIILLDELTLLADSRASLKKTALIFSYLVLQCRKRSNDLYYTAQNFGLVDKRIRDQTDLLIFCKMALRFEGIGGKIEFRETDRRTFKPDEYDSLYIRNLICKRNELGYFDEIKIVYIKAQPIFEYYDTTKLIKME